MGGFLAGDYTPHPNSLLFNAFPGFWPFKMFWFFRKVSLRREHLDKGTVSVSILLTLHRLARSPSFRTSLSLLRATPTMRSRAATSTSACITDRSSKQRIRRAASMDKLAQKTSYLKRL